MSVRGLSNSSTKQYCISYHAKVQGDEYHRTVTIREKFPPTGYRSFTAARNDFQQFARSMGSIVFVNVTGVSFGSCTGTSSGGSGGGGCTAPQSPVITATADEDSIFIDWAAVSGATSYIVKRSTVQGGPYVEIAPNVVPSQYDDTTASPSTVYYYVVSAVNSCGTSGNSNEVSSQLLVSDGWIMADQATFSDLAGTVPSVNGGVVKCWKDQSGDGIDVIWASAGGPAPILVTGALNGLPIVRWVAGANDSMVYVGGSLTSPITFITAVKFTGNTSVAPLASPFLRASAGSKICLTGTTNHVGISSSLLNSGITVDAGVVANGVFAILTFVANGSDSYIRVNGVQVATGTALTTSWINIVLGEVPLGMDLAELIRANGSVPTQAFIDAKEAYLSAKWALPI